MAALFFREERDIDFLSACEEVRRESGYLPPYKIASKAVMKPAMSFYLHPREYLLIICGNGRKLPRKGVKRELHLEILSRYGKLKKLFHDKNLIARMIAGQTAPRFYISEARAVSLYYELLKHKKKMRV
ncbi:hypothetical protein FACS1894181_13240 [Bacteroidia bacterium]|nr:hypothetical protein FACS1894181_13240 [Bacteroidia bacterium]